MSKKVWGFSLISVLCIGGAFLCAMMSVWLLIDPVSEQKIEVLGLSAWQSWGFAATLYMLGSCTLLILRNALLERQRIKSERA